jgi:hypothetical protein
MPWGRRDNPATVAGRALVVPYDARNALGNENNLSPNGRATTEIRLVVSSVDGGHQSASGQQRVSVPVPNWLRIVLYYAGSNYGPSGLPDEVHVPVLIDPATGAIVAVDVDRAGEELKPYRDAAVGWWKETEAPLAPVRAAISAPGDAVRGAKSLLAAWRGALANFRNEPGTEPALTPAESEQSRRTANVLKYTLERNPKQLAKVRASALQAGPMMVANVKGGSMTQADFETWLQFQSTSGAITADEADAWRQAASGH